MTPDQLQQKEKARVVPVAIAADASSSPSASLTMENPSPPPSRRPARARECSDSKKRLSLALASGAAPASSASGARPASSAAADALHFYAWTLPTSLTVVVMMFGLYAATAYGLPHVLCKDTATDEVNEGNVFFHRPFAGASRRGERRKELTLFLFFFSKRRL